MKRAPKACATPGCPNLVYGPGKCAVCRAEADKRRNESRRERKRFYDSIQWKRIREYVLAKEPLCRHCKQAGRVTASSEVDHIDGDIRNNGPANLQALCKPCHSAKTVAEQGGFGA